MQTWIPRTKLYPPDTSRVVVRKRLLDELQKAVSTCKLTLISAPAGSGKTTLISNLAQLSMPIAWLSLDETDNDPSTFISALAASFQVLDMAYGATVESVFDIGINVDLKHFMAKLVNDTLGAPPFLLVLDDLHVIYEQSILQAIDFFLERLPSSIHVLISTRHDPPLSLARLRAQGQLCELRLEALRFGISETTVLMNEHLELALTDADLQSIIERTDGWVAGLRLIGLSLSQVDNALRSQRITQIIGDNRYIFELLVDEVLKQQDVVIRDFLMMTSILEELSPDVCDAVTNRKDSLPILLNMYRNNLFLRLMDAGTNIYRYHDLFADFLRHQLQIEHPDLIGQLHLRAAAAETIPTRKIYHSLEAAAWDSAAELIIQHGRKMVETGNRLTVQKWIDMLPESVRIQHGWLVYLQGILAYHRADYAQARPLLDQAQTQFRAQGDNEGIAAAIVMHYAASEVAEQIAGLEELLRSLAPFSLSYIQQLYVELAPAWAYLYEGHRARSAKHFLNALQLTHQHPELEGLLGFHIAATIVLAFDDVIPLQFQLQALLTGLENKVNVLKPAILSIMAQIALWQGDPHSARRLINQSYQYWDNLGGVPHLHNGMMVWQEVIVASMLHNELEMERLTHRVHDNMNHAVYLAAFRARNAWLKQDFIEAREIANKIPSYFRPGIDLDAEAYLASVEALIDLNNGSIEQVEKRLQPYIDGQRDVNYYSLFILDLRVILAYCYVQKGMYEEALQCIEPMLVECERANTPGRIAQEGDFAAPLMELAVQHNVRATFAQRVLDMLTTDQSPRSIKIEETGDILTPREVEVLRLLVNGATNRDISETFVISIPTVKTHVSRILQKLNVATRTQAAAKARKLSL
jgi:LuxR family transcriptional regulator, maltose regulon positive regulatory protein